MSTQSNPIDAAASFVAELNERRKAEDAFLSESMESQSQPGEPEGAINPITGEINWDCPCLAEMVKPPCGDNFKAAFSCFVASTTEPKGMDCVDKFKEMQICFKENPDVYGRDGEDDDAFDDEDEPAK
jgi:intermembrane space import and assembly protein 40